MKRYRLTIALDLIAASSLCNLLSEVIQNQVTFWISLLCCLVAFVLSIQEVVEHSQKRILRIPSLLQRIQYRGPCPLHWIRCTILPPALPSLHAVALPRKKISKISIFLFTNWTPCGILLTRTVLVNEVTR